MDKVRARKLKTYKNESCIVCKALKLILSIVNMPVKLLSQAGLLNCQIAQQCDYSTTWIRKLIHRLNRGGVEAIAWYPYYCGTRGPRKFFAEIVEKIFEITLSPPMKLTGISVWSLPNLRDYLKERRIIDSISLESLRQILRRHKIRW